MIIRPLIACLMTLTIDLCSVVQFHHHDRVGNIFIYSQFGEVELGAHHIPTHIHSDGHRCNHHHHDDSCGDSSDCSMHLDQLTTDDSHLKLPKPVISHEFIVVEEVALPEVVESVFCIFCRGPGDCAGPVQLRIETLRGPPMCEQLTKALGQLKVRE